MIKCYTFYEKLYLIEQQSIGNEEDQIIELIDFQIDVIEAIADNSSKVFKNQLLPILNDTMYLFIGLMQLTNEIALTYKEDPNLFIVSEEIDLPEEEWNLRAAGKVKIGRFLENYDKNAIEAVTVSVSKHLLESEQLRKQGVGNW